MGNKTTCLKCGAPLTGDARGGFCPQCLFAQASAGDSNDLSHPGLLEPSSTAAAEASGLSDPVVPLDRTCVECGAELPANAPQELCPRCLVGMGLRLALQADQSSSGAESTASVPPEPSQQSQSAPPTSRCFGDYELLEEIARGGMGIVFKARQKKLDRLVAVKVILAGEFASREQALRFRAEVEAAARLQHPNIVSIHETGEQEGQPYFSMDYVKGTNLAALVREKPLPAKRAAGYVKVIAEAIHYAHEQGILHRDLKPSNVLIDATDQPRVTDFGLAKRMQKESFLTVTGDVMGSPSFMPPEQAGAKDVKAGRYSDVYPLGGILFYLVTGRPPFVAENVAETLHHVLNTEPVSPRLLNPSVPQDIATICLKCLEKEPAKRYQTAQELADELNRFLRDVPINARPANPAEKLWRWCLRKPVIATLAFSLSCTVFVGFTGVLWQARRARFGELAARENLYAADMNLAQQALAVNNLGRARELLERNRPKAGDQDLRHWEWRYLWQQCRSDALFSLSQQVNSVFAISFSPDGKWLASGGTQGHVKIWDVGARQVMTLLSGGQIGVVAFSPRGDLLATTAEKGVVKIWETAAWSEVTQLRHEGAIRSVNFSSDGRLLAVLARDQGLAVTVSLWSLEKTNRLANLPVGSFRSGHHGMVVISPNDQWLVVGEGDGHIRVFELATLIERFDFAGPAEGITALAFAPDSNILASGSGFNDSSIRLWSLVTGRETRRLEGHAAWVTALAFSPDGKLLASASADHTIRLWETDKWREAAILRGHQHEVWGVVFSPDSKTLASGAKDGEINVWSAWPKQRIDGLVTLPGVIRDASFSSDSHSLVTQNEDGSISLWDTATLGQPLHLTALGTNNVGVLYSPKGILLAVGTRYGAIKLLDLAKPRQVEELVGSRKMVIRPLCFTKDVKFLFGGAAETLVAPWTSVSGYTRWAVNSGQGMVSWAAPKKTIRIAFSPDGAFAILGDEDGIVRIWEVAQRPERMQVVAHNHYLSGVAFSRNGKLFATASTQGDAKIWDLASRTPLATLRGHLLGVHSVAFSPDGRRLVTASGGREAVKLWDVITRQEVATLEAHGSIFQGVQFSPDGNTILAISADGALHLWRAPSLADIEATEKLTSVKMPSSTELP